MLIDIHVHTARPHGLTRPNGSRFPSPEELIGRMDECGIDKAVVLCSVSPECAYVFVTAEEVLDICAEHPDRLIPFANVDPRMLTHTADADFGPLLAHYAARGCRGIGEYCPNLPFDDPLNLNLLRQAEQAGLPVTFHIGPTLGGCYGCWDEPGLPRLERVLLACPNLILLGHSQPFWAEISADATEENRGGYPRGPVTPGRVVQLMRRHPNLYGDLSARSGFNAISRDPQFGCEFMEEFQDRLLFGTDIANHPQDLPIVPYFRSLRREGLISAAAWEKIAHANAERLLGIGPA